MIDTDILQDLKNKIADSIIYEQETKDKIPTLWINKENAVKVLKYLKDEIEDPFKMLYDLTAIDERARTNKNNFPETDFTVVYHLLLDYKMKKTLRGKNNSDKNKWPQIAQSPPVQITLEMVMNRGKFDDRESSMTSPRHFTKEDLTIDTSEQNTSDWWHLGISCTDKTSNEIMKDVYGVLKKMDMVCFFFT